MTGKQKKETKVSYLIARTPHTYLCHKPMRTNPLGQSETSMLIEIPLNR